MNRARKSDPTADPAAVPAPTLDAATSLADVDTTVGLMRKIATFARLDMLCGREGCARRSTCMEERAPCFHELLPFLREFYFPGMRNSVLHAAGRPTIPLPPPRPVEDRIDSVILEMIATGRLKP